MRRALVYAREGQVDGFKEGLHGQLHKITFEAEYGDFMLDMGREDWITKFRGLFAQHLTNPEKAPGCLLGHATLQLFMLFFVDSRGHGLFPKELAPRASWSSSLEERAVCYSDFVEPEMWNLPNVLATRLRLLRAVRWMNLLESGWPIFKILSLVTYHGCRRKQRQCSARCPEVWINRLMVMIEDKVGGMSERLGGRLGPEHLRSLAMELSSSRGPWLRAQRSCGPLFVALGAASCAVAMARMAHWRETYLYVSMTEAHLADLGQRAACAESMLLQTPHLWEILGYVEDEVQAASPHGFGKPCHLSFCPDGGSPDHSTCTCRSMGKSTSRLSSRMCIISTDPGGDRPLETEPQRLVAEDPEKLTRFWSLTFHLNRLYALLHGYRFRRPDVSHGELGRMLSDGMEPPRRVQWAIVRLVQQELEDRRLRLCGLA
ncbi:unnamed protein product [Effrenium voratum]|uniref:Uncharacterized protein n=1 Tax=Effrenium voratum TaxID=2562239 RepID=A0AA36JDB4_9DINO|nr:unnamed protein product [Effrenium voratum]